MNTGVVHPVWEATISLCPAAVVFTRSSTILIWKLRNWLASTHPVLQASITSVAVIVFALLAEAVISHKKPLYLLILVGFLSSSRHNISEATPIVGSPVTERFPLKVLVAMSKYLNIPAVAAPAEII